MLRAIPFVVLLLLVIALLAAKGRPSSEAAVPGPVAPSPSPTPATFLIQGDVNGDGVVDAVDALQVLRSVAGLSTNAAYLAQTGDTDGDGDIDAVDALRILRYVAGLPNTTPPGWPPIGQPVGPTPVPSPGPSPSPTPVLPSAYVGYASATHTLTVDGVSITTNMSATGLRLAGPANYQMVQGVIDVQVTGSGGGCTVSGQYAVNIGGFFYGYIGMDTTNYMYAANGSVLNGGQSVLWTCPDTPPFYMGDLASLWLLTTDLPDGTPPPPGAFYGLVPDRPFSPEDPLQGSFDATITGSASHFEWHFDPVFCPGDPAC